MDAATTHMQDEIIAELEAQLTAANKRIGELEEGLEPFALALTNAETFVAGPDGYDFHELAGETRAGVTLHEFARARALLSPSGSQSC